MSNSDGSGRELLDQPASKMIELLRARRVSSEELVRASLARIEELDPALNAFIHVDSKGAVRAAREADKNRRPLGPLHGLPIAVKDLTDVQGMPTSHGSRLYANIVAQVDDESVHRLRRAGAIVVGKTNTPEFGFGAVCTNRLVGPTRNPWDRELTSGGSSGGSAVAVTTGMVPIAQGTDYGGSVRTPASFCGCVGLRPTPGHIPEPRRFFGWDSLATQGVLARTVVDAELMLNVMAGPHPLDPLSVRGRTGPALSGGWRAASSATLGGAFPLDPEVNTAFDEAVGHVSEVFGQVARAEPRVDGASEAFQVLRAAQSWAKFKGLISDHRADLTDSFVWNVERGSGIKADAFLEAEQVRTRTYRNFVEFFNDYDVLVMPAASVLPFRIDQGEVGEIAGEPTQTIIDYLACTYLISLVGFPSIVLPAPNRPRGLPFGIQLVAAPDREATLLSAARALEEAGFRYTRPPSSAAPGTAAQERQGRLS